MFGRLTVGVSIALAAGCGGDAGDAVVDASPGPDARTSCASSDPVRGETAFAGGGVVIPSGLSSDELTAYYVISRPFEPPTPPDSDVYVATRAAVDQPFGAGVPVATAQTTKLEYSGFESADGRELFFSREDQGGISIRMYRATRTARDQPFGTATVMPLDRLALDGTISRDGTELFYLHIFDYTSTATQIYRVTRTSGAFAGGTPVLSSMGADDLGSPVLSADALTLYFAKVVDGQLGIWSLHRPLVGGPWSGPDALAGGTGASPLWESADGCRLYVARGRSTVILTR